jgi:hypothetical protein
MNYIFCCCKLKDILKEPDTSIEDLYPIVHKKDNEQYINNIEIPKEWIEKCSGSGETYWFNTNTYERSYKKPNRKVVPANKI